MLKDVQFLMGPLSLSLSRKGRGEASVAYATTYVRSVTC